MLGMNNNSPARQCTNLFGLPIELRLQIYAYVLQASPSVVTFGSALLTGNAQSIEDRLYVNGRCPWEALPKGHIPVVEPRYDTSLLSLHKSAQVAAHGATRPEELGWCDYTPRPPLLLVCRQVYAEIKANMSASKRQQLSMLSIVMSYPAGLHVYHSIGTQLLPGTQTITVTGTYTNDAFSARQAAKISTSHKTVMSEQLRQMVSSAFATGMCTTLIQLRIYFPGRDSYSTVWGDDDSPIVVAAKSVVQGDLNIEIWRGVHGTGVVFVVMRSSDGRRNATTTWHRLPETVEGIDDWLIDGTRPDDTSTEA